MSLPISEEDFIEFLVSAKQSTYAAPDESQRVQPALPGSRQYEYRQGALFYLDIYFGVSFFTGQETVYYKTEPIWGMSYAGGAIAETPKERVSEIYAFLKEALRAADVKNPFRGPASFEREAYRYGNRVLGNWRRFSGTETIFLNDSSIYQLHYSGGLLR